MSEAAGGEARGMHQHTVVVHTVLYSGSVHSMFKDRKREEGYDRVFQLVELFFFVSCSEGMSGGLGHPTGNPHTPS